MKNRIIAIICLLTFLMIFLSCATGINYIKHVDNSTIISDSKSYVYGRFELKHKSKYRLAIELTDMNTEQKYAIRLSKEKPIISIEIPPGKYQIKNYLLSKIIIGPSMGEGSDFVRPEYNPDGFSEPFQIEKGNAYYIGDYFGFVETGFSLLALKTQGVINKVENNFEATTKGFKNINSKFNLIPVKSISN